MLQRRWYRVIVVALLGSGAWVGAGRSPVRAQTAQEAGFRATPVASVLQIMKVLTSPSSEIVFSAVQTVSTARGVETVAPKNAEEWKAVEDNAAMLAESGNLLLMGDRVRDQGDWIKMSRELIEASIVAMSAAKANDADALNASLDGLYLTCERCHLKYFP